MPGLPIAGLLSWMWWWRKRRDQRSKRPFLQMPRPPGWSLQSRTEDLMSDFMLNTMMIALLGGIAWAFYVAQGNLLTSLLIAVPGSAIFLYLARKNLLCYANHRLGLLGEQVVGGVLDRLSSPTTHVFHDLEIKQPGRKPWNIDHIVVTTTGVSLIETKARRKQVGESADGQKGHKLVFDGKQLIFPSPMRPDRHGLKQAARNAEWLSAKLSQLNGTPVPVSPALVFPGWFIDRKAKGDVSVLNEKEIESFLGRRGEILSPERLRAICGQLQDLSKVEFG